MSCLLPIGWRGNARRSMKWSRIIRVTWRRDMTTRRQVRIESFVANVKVSRSVGCLLTAAIRSLVHAHTFSHTNSGRDSERDNGIFQFA